MTVRKYFDRLQRMHHLIRTKRAGSPVEFAEKLEISVSLLYQLLSDMKAMGAPVYFCHIRSTYCYSREVDLAIGFFQPNSFTHLQATSPVL